MEILMKLFINYSGHPVTCPIKTSENETKVQVIPRNGISTNLYLMDERTIAKTDVEANITIFDCDNFGINPIHNVMDVFYDHN